MVHPLKSTIVVDISQARPREVPLGRFGGGEVRRSTGRAAWLSASTSPGDVSRDENEPDENENGHDRK
jgi:hypothetical protein